MDKQKERLASVSSLHIVNLDTIDCHELVLTILRVLKTCGGTGPGLHCEHSLAPLVESHQVTQPEHWDGDEETYQDGHQSGPLQHSETIQTTNCTISALSDSAVDTIVNVYTSETG